MRPSKQKSSSMQRTPSVRPAKRMSFSNDQNVRRTKMEEKKIKSDERPLKNTKPEEKPAIKTTPWGNPNENNTTSKRLMGKTEAIKKNVSQLSRFRQSNEPSYSTKGKCQSARTNRNDPVKNTNSTNLSTRQETSNTQQDSPKRTKLLANTNQTRINHDNNNDSKTRSSASDNSPQWEANKDNNVRLNNEGIPKYSLKTSGRNTDELVDNRTKPENSFKYLKSDPISNSNAEELIDKMKKQDKNSSNNSSDESPIDVYKNQENPSKYILNTSNKSYISKNIDAEPFDAGKKQEKTQPNIASHQEISSENEISIKLNPIPEIAYKVTQTDFIKAIPRIQLKVMKLREAIDKKICGINLKIRSLESRVDNLIPQ